jgi:hypothetical protein
MATLQPAYGRDYKGKAAILEDFLAGKDFILNDRDSQWDGKPCNRESLEQSGYRQVNVRYKGDRLVCVLKRKGDTWVV